MGKRAVRNKAVCLGAIALTCVSSGASPASAESGQRAGVVCTWGGTPIETTGSIRISPGLTFTPAERALDFRATGLAECTDGFAGRVTFDGVIQAGGTCVMQVFEGKVKGLPGVDSFYGPGIGGIVHEFLYDGEGNIVGSDQPQVWSGVGQGSEISDCGTEKGVTDAIFSSTIELWG